MTLTSLITATDKAAQFLDKRSLTTLRLLTIIIDRGDVYSSEIAREFEITPAALHDHVQKLFELGLIEKTQGTKKPHRRKFFLQATKEGKQVIRKILTPRCS
tara:strand:+ start:723 stop:1028 length:306 start_codon:yes stop_codon:yes gene_type:complete